MLPRSWKPVPARGQILVGPRGDGGYVVAEDSIAPVTLLLSMGLNDDWRFEAAFRRRTGARVLCYDGTVTHRFWLRYTAEALLRFKFARAFRYLRYRRFFSSPDVRHERLMIGYDATGSVSLRAILARERDAHVFLKMDIEGSEYRVLDDIVRHAHRFTGIVIEFHDVDLHHERIDRFLAAMSDFAITGAHANNWAGADPKGDPMVVELTLTRRGFVHPPECGETPPSLPPSNAARPDIALQYG